VLLLCQMGAEHLDGGLCLEIGMFTQVDLGEATPAYLAEQAIVAELLARMAVFCCGCSLEAIESVCSEGLSIDVLDGLASLVDKNLLQQC
jgi:hypothetical protein